MFDDICILGYTWMRPFCIFHSHVSCIHLGERPKPFLVYYWSTAPLNKHSSIAEQRPSINIIDNWRVHPFELMVEIKVIKRLVDELDFLHFPAIFLVNQGSETWSARLWREPSKQRWFGRPRVRPHWDDASTPQSCWWLGHRAVQAPPLVTGMVFTCFYCRVVSYAKKIHGHFAHFDPMRKWRVDDASTSLNTVESCCLCQVWVVTTGAQVGSEWCGEAHVICLSPFCEDSLVHYTISVLSVCQLFL